MKTYFYSHLVHAETIYAKLDSLPIDTTEKAHLQELFELTLRNTAMHTILDHLSESDKKHFIDQEAEGDYEELWEFLKERSIAIEEKLRHALTLIVKELEHDISSLSS